MDQQQQQLIDRIKQAQNVLVTVSTNPTVDQLASAIGLTLALNKLEKHGTAVFSGKIPDTLDFLKPEDTLEPNTDSLRDFIIALDKSKADKLRYKVEDEVVRIFITPYKTSLSEKDLQFSQGDFNVDVVVALGVKEPADLDTAITAHGRILHDATVATVDVGGKADLGTINWVDEQASSLSEMMLGLIDGLDNKLLDGQMATALLTGIVANTDRFRNERTTPQAMSVSAELMAAGANQQLIATELEAAPPAPAPMLHVPSEEPAEHKDESPDLGLLSITHDYEEEHQHPEDQHEDHHKDHASSKTRDLKPPDDAPDVPAPTPAKPAEYPRDSLKPNKADFRAPAFDPGTLADQPKPEEPEEPQVRVDENGKFSTDGGNHGLPHISQVRAGGSDDAEPSKEPEVHRGIIEGVPGYGKANPLTASALPTDEDVPTEELSLPPVEESLLSHNEQVLPPMPPVPSANLSDSFIPQAPLPEPYNEPDNEPPHNSAGPVPAPAFASAPAPAPFWEPPKPPAPSAQAPFGPQPPAYSPSGPAGPIHTDSPFGPMQASSSAAAQNETLDEIEQSVHSPHLRDNDDTDTAKVPEHDVNDARSAVAAALSGGATAANDGPITALNALPLGPELHHGAPAAPKAPALPRASAEPTPGDTPADQTLDMPLPSGNPFGPAQALPVAPSNNGGQMPPPPVPPPMLPPM